MFGRAYSSTNERCVDTKEGITDRTCTGLKGLNYGSLEAHHEYLAENNPKKCEACYLQFGGKSSLTVRKRILDTSITIMEEEDKQTVLSVCHGGSSFNFLK